MAQRARNKRQVKTIHAKIANRRKDVLHTFSRKLVNRCGEIYVGNVSRLKFVKTKMAKPVLDVGWGQLKGQLQDIPNDSITPMIASTFIGHMVNRFIILLDEK